MKTLACLLLLGITASGCALQYADEESDDFSAEAADMEPGLETSSIFEHGEVSIEVDEDGFMAEPEQWDEEVEPALTSDGSTSTTIRWSVCSLPLACR